MALTAEQLERVLAQRRAQGLPDRIEDPSVIARLQQIDAATVPAEKRTA